MNGIQLNTDRVFAEIPGRSCAYNDHLIVVAVWFGELNVECLFCGLEETEDLPQEWKKLSDNQKAAYKLSKIAQYERSCPQQYEGLSEFVVQKAKDELYGSPITSLELQKAAAKINEELPYSYDVSISVDQN